MAEVKRETKTVTFRVDKTTVQLIDLLDQSGHYKSKGHIVDTAIRGYANNQLLGDRIEEMEDCMKESNKLLEKLCEVICYQNDVIDEMQKQIDEINLKIDYISIDD